MDEQESIRFDHLQIAINRLTTQVAALTNAQNMLFNFLIQTSKPEIKEPEKLGVYLWITDGYRDDRIKPGTEIPEGWRHGRSNVTCGKDLKDSVWITNGFKNKRVMKDDPLPVGWRYGKWK